MPSSPSCSVLDTEVTFKKSNYNHTNADNSVKQSAWIICVLSTPLHACSLIFIYVYTYNTPSSTNHLTCLGCLGGDLIILATPPCMYDFVGIVSCFRYFLFNISWRKYSLLALKLCFLSLSWSLQIFCIAIDEADFLEKSQVLELERGEIMKLVKLFIR